MIEIKCEQGSEEWRSSRIGLVSGSRFKDILTDPKSKTDKDAGNLSQTAETYLNELVSAIISGQSPEIKGAALEWGHQNEPLARAEYELMTDTDVIETGIFVHYNRKIGASPDGLVGDDGMIEIKCPWNSANHVATVRSRAMPPEHMPQVQGNLWLNGRKWCDFISYDPRLPVENCRLFIVRVHRDNEYIAQLEKKVMNFVKKLDSVLSESFGFNWSGVQHQRSSQADDCDDDDWFDD